MLTDTSPKEILIRRLLRKLPSVHERLDCLQDGKTDGVAKRKLHHVLHSGYRTKTTMAGARSEFSSKSGFSEGEAFDEGKVRKFLETRKVNQLKRLDRLVKPDPRIYLDTDGNRVSFDDIKSLGRSPAESDIQSALQAVDLKANPGQLEKDLEEYGFSIIKTDDLEKERISKAFDGAREYFNSTNLATKKELNFDDPSIDVEYRAAKKAESSNSNYRPMENISAQRPFIYDSKYDSRWNAAAAQDLRYFIKDIAELLENKSQEILASLEALFKLPSKTFSRTGSETDQSTLRLIHCISDDEANTNPDSYFDESTKPKSFSKEEPDHSCVGIHTDWGLITLLPTATSQGLEFWFNDEKNNGKNSGWVKLNSKPGELIVMPGNIAEIISGGKLKSVPHRVISEGGRLSYAYFTELGKNTSVDDLKSELSDAGLGEAENVSLFEEEMRPYLIEPEQAITGENYLLHMMHRNTRDPGSKLISYARDKGLFLTEGTNSNKSKKKAPK